MKPAKSDIAVLLITAAALAAMIAATPRSGGEAVVLTARPAESAGIPAPPAETPAEPSAEEGVRYPLDLNTATAEELETLPSIGPARAKRIVDYREEHGPFRYVEELRNVSGIGEGILAGLMDYVIVEEQSDG